MLCHQWAVAVFQKSVLQYFFQQNFALASENNTFQEYNNKKYLKIYSDGEIVKILEKINRINT